mgnify:CR=1 FL=1
MNNGYESHHIQTSQKLGEKLELMRMMSNFCIANFSHGKQLSNRRTNNTIHHKTIYHSSKLSLSYLPVQVNTVYHQWQPRSRHHRFHTSQQTFTKQTLKQSNARNTAAEPKYVWASRACRTGTAFSTALNPLSQSTRSCPADKACPYGSALSKPMFVNSFNFRNPSGWII